jgi:hypothetical protein
MKEIEVLGRRKELDFFQWKEESLEVKKNCIIGPNALECE